MSSRQAIVVTVAVVVFGLLTAVGARWARGEQRKTPIYLNFWRVDDGAHAQMVELTIPRTGEACPDGFSLTENPAYCGRDIFVQIALYVNGDRYGAERQQMHYERSSSGYWRAYVRTFPGLREIKVEPFRDDFGLMLSVTGTIRLRLDKNEWYVTDRIPERSFFAETEPGFPFVRHLECVAGDLGTRASL